MVIDMSDAMRFESLVDENKDAGGNDIETKARRWTYGDDSSDLRMAIKELSERVAALESDDDWA